jgi:hypothetical protein
VVPNMIGAALTVKSSSANENATAQYRGSAPATPICYGNFTCAAI